MPAPAVREIGRFRASNGADVAVLVGATPDGRRVVILDVNDGVETIALPAVDAWTMIDLVRAALAP